MPNKGNNNPLQNVAMVECYICKALGLKPSRTMLPLSEAVLVPNPRGLNLYRHKKHKSATLKKYQEIRAAAEAEKGAPSDEEKRRIEIGHMTGLVAEAITTLKNYANFNGMSVVIMFESKE